MAGGGLKYGVVVNILKKLGRVITFLKVDRGECTRFWGYSTANKYQSFGTTM